MLTGSPNLLAADGVLVRVGTVVPTGHQMSDMSEHRKDGAYGNVSKRRWETAAMLSVLVLTIPQAPRPANRGISVTSWEN